MLVLLVMRDLHVAGGNARRETQFATGPCRGATASPFTWTSTRMGQSTGTATKWHRWSSSRRRFAEWRGSANAPRVNVMPEKRTRYEVVAQVLAHGSARARHPLGARVRRGPERCSEPALRAHRRFGDPANSSTPSANQCQNAERETRSAGTAFRLLVHELAGHRAHSGSQCVAVSRRCR